MQLLIVNEHPLVRHALEELLRKAFPAADLSVAQSHDEAGAALAQRPADLVVTDLACRRTAAHQSLSDLVGMAAPGRVVVFGECGLGLGVRHAMASGVHGYIPATSRPDLIAAAVGLVAAGGVYFPEVPAHNGRPHGANGRDGVARLSSRQLEVFRALKEGKSNKAIARELLISVAAVKQHVQSILKLSGARNRTEAVALLSRPSAPAISLSMPGE
jgi:DNA-binding NarL/FixJ family response regulator